MQPLTRRSFVRRSAQTAASLSVAGAFAGEAIAKPHHVVHRNPLLNARPGHLAGRQKLAGWNDYLAGLGSRHTGGESQARFVHDLRGAMRQLGWKTSYRTQTFKGWEAKEYSLSITPVGKDQRNVDVAYYYPYSGRTGKNGVSGELAYANRGSAADFAAGSFAGKIAVIDVDPFAIPIGVAFNAYDANYADDVDITKPYDRSWLATGPALDAAKNAGAAGAIIVLPDVPADAKGQYGPFGQPYQGLPALNIDTRLGSRVRDWAKAGGTNAKLKLTAGRPAGETKSLMAVLEGASDEVVVVNTHTDGTNLIEENGALAMLSLAQRLSGIPKSKRPATCAFYFATGHFQADVASSAAYVTEYPDLFSRTKAGLTIEHLGCPEYIDDHEGSYEKSGKPEISGIFAANQTLADEIARPAIEAKNVTRCTVIRPVPLFFGEGASLYQAGIPMLAYISGPDYLLAERSTRIQLDRFDVRRMQAETRAFRRMLDQLAASTPSVLG